LRRQPGFGRIAPAGSSRDERLDPFRLPVLFAVEDNTADWRLRTVELASERVVLRRTLRGMKMTISLPISNYLGIALQINPPASPNAAVELALEHSDRAFSVPLCRAKHACDVVADWQSWSSVLGIPPLLVEADGSLREAFARVGALRVGSPTWRRRRRSAISGRRPRILLRRKPGRQTGEATMRSGSAQSWQQTDGHGLVQNQGGE
jgi:hypothetical protein